MAGIVTALELQKRRKERVNVHLDGEFAFGLSLHLAADLQRGQFLADAQIAALQALDQAEQAYRSALRYLAARPRSRAETERHLARKGFGPEVIPGVLERLAAQEYLDDEDFARFWVENRSRFRPRSGAALAGELRQKGVDRDTARAAAGAVDDEEAAWAAVAPKLPRWRMLPVSELDKKLGAYLARRGFDYDTIRRVSRRAAEFLQAEDEP